MTASDGIQAGGLGRRHNQTQDQCDEKPNDNNTTGRVATRPASSLAGPSGDNGLGRDKDTMCSEQSKGLNVSRQKTTTTITTTATTADPRWQQHS